MSTVPQNIRFKQMAACLAAAFALAPGAALSTTRIVNTCDDDDSLGSLRSQINAASSYDTIDLSTAQLTCSTITLEAGEILIPQNTLTLKGPADRTVAITTQPYFNRLLRHTGGGYLIMEHLTFGGGEVNTNYNLVYAGGGCILTYGSVSLSYATVSGCSATTGGQARGGAVWAGLNVAMDHSVVSGSTAKSFYQSARGGGVYGFNVSMNFSTVSGNTAFVGTADGESRGGGVYARDLFFAVNSSVDSNHAQTGGGIYIGEATLSVHSAFLLENSTISGNSASIRGGGIFLGTSPYMGLTYNSTVAFNSAPSFAGIYISKILAWSSIIAKNTNTLPGGFADLYVRQGGYLGGADNLIVSYNSTGLPGTITVTSDPQLAPLANHGGQTRTHALLATSPAIEHDTLRLAFDSDQRGPGFSRVVNGTADIGAYERQVNDDEVFYGGFD